MSDLEGLEIDHTLYIESLQRDLSAMTERAEKAGRELAETRETLDILRDTLRDERRENKANYEMNVGLIRERSAERTARLALEADNAALVAAMEGVKYYADGTNRAWHIAFEALRDHGTGLAPEPAEPEGEKG